MNNTKKILINRMDNLRHIPVVLMLAIYLPASIFGIFAFSDKYALSLLGLLAIFVATYYGLYKYCVSIIHLCNLDYLKSIGCKIKWRLMSWVVIWLYAASLLAAVITTPETPLVAALTGGDWLDISIARGNLLANRDGWDVVLRYLVVILGRSVMPLIVTILFLNKDKLRYWGLLSLLFSYTICLEKASAIFAFSPLVLASIVQGCGKKAATYLGACLIFISAVTFLSSGGLDRAGIRVFERTAEPLSHVGTAEKLHEGFKIGRRGDPNRHYFFNFVNEMGIPFDFSTSGDDFFGRLMIMTNRSLWIPYVTAYDWLRFHDEILGGRLTMGQSIGFVSWLTNNPKIQLEKMVYEYEFGIPPGGAGASNTVFLVDSKLAFGWVGVLIYCSIFVFCSAVIFSSNNDAAKLASITNFFTASLSPLTATLFSGGLIITMLICLLAPSNSLTEKVIIE